MMTLPPDFWTRPQHGGVAGLGTGAAVGIALSFYYFFSARVRFGSGRMSFWRRLSVTISIKIIIAFCMIVGALISSLIVLALEQRDFWTGIAVGVMGVGLFIVLGAIAVQGKRPQSANAAIHQISRP
jgi:hypothetical protein